MTNTSKLYAHDHDWKLGVLSGKGNKWQYRSKTFVPALNLQRDGEGESLSLFVPVDTSEMHTSEMADFVAY